MDSKYEFNLKMDQLKKLIAQDDMKTAYKIVDSVDWNRVRNVNLLTMAATVYERNDHIEEAKEILTAALDRAPVGKRMLYKLSELSVLTGDLDDAEDYYYEFRKTDPTDIGNYLLQYMILKGRHAPYDKQAQALELYTEADPDEKWLYELAATYDRAGEGDKCVAVADKIALLYGSTEYSAKAMRLKLKYATLSSEQQDILYPRSYMDKARVNEEPQEESDLFRVYGITDEPDISTVEALKSPPAEEYDSGRGDFAEATKHSDALAADRYDDEDSAFDEYLRQMDLAARYEHRREVARKLDAPASGPEKAPAEAQEEAPASEPAEESSDDSAQLSFVFEGDEARVIKDEEPEPSPEEAETPPSEMPAPAAPAPAAPAQTAPAPAAPAPAPKKWHMIVEAGDLKKAFQIAIDELKAIHRENGIDNTAAKTTADKLNSTGFTDAIRDRVRAKDLIIEGAGSLDKEILQALSQFITTDTSGTVVVLLDTPEGMDALEEAEPELFDLCDYISDEEESEAYEDDYDEDVDEDEEASQGARISNLKKVEPADDKEQMEIDDFAQFCTQYAASIDCSITGKSMLALYERIELMEEDGIPLTKESAVDLIEEAADKAEKPPIGKRIAGAFHSKYDKNGLLILKEDDFI